MMNPKNKLLIGIILSSCGWTIQAASLHTEATTTEASGTFINPPSTTGFVVGDNSSAQTVSFEAIAPGETGIGIGNGTLSNLFIQITLAPEETLGATSMRFTAESFDDGLLIKINNATIVDFNSSNYNFADFNDKYDLGGNSGWDPWNNEGNPQLLIDLVAGTVRLMVDTVTGGREDALLDMQENPTPDPVPSLDFSTGVTFSSTFKNSDGLAGIGQQTLIFNASVLTEDNIFRDGFEDTIVARSRKRDSHTSAPR